MPDSAEETRLTAQYQNKTLDLPGAKRLRDILLEVLLMGDADAAGDVAAGVRLIGVNALIERLSGRAH